MAELSPAAQAVLDAYGNQIGGTDAIMGSERRGVAAALRAAADLVVPLRTKTPWGSTVKPSTEAFAIHAALYSIAIELDS